LDFPTMGAAALRRKRTVSRNTCCLRFKLRHTLGKQCWTCKIIETRQKKVIYIRIGIIVRRKLFLWVQVTYVTQPIRFGIGFHVMHATGIPMSSGHIRDSTNMFWNQIPRHACYGFYIYIYMSPEDRRNSSLSVS
jgi:hypothetical protein